MITTTTTRFDYNALVYSEQIAKRISQLQNENFAERLWSRDESLWKKYKAGSVVPLGWLHAIDKMLDTLPEVEDFCRTIKSGSFKHVVVLGMGGSSMTPLVFKEVFAEKTQGLSLIVLDSVHPAAIKKTEESIDLAKTLFIVSSKSGTTAEIRAFFNYFFHKVASVKNGSAGENFAAITDEGTPLAALARKNEFRKIFINFPDIGGRFSALSCFGIIPAALMGVDVRKILERSSDMAQACGPRVVLSKNPGIMLGILLGEAALSGRNKLRYCLPDRFSALGLWLEQLIAESTGKKGVGILPVPGKINAGGLPGKDQVLLEMTSDAERSESVKNSLIRISIKDEFDLGAEFFRWEIAVATAGWILGVDPFDQPNVQESKTCTDQLLAQISAEGKFPRFTPSFCQGKINFYTKEKLVTGFGSLLEKFIGMKQAGNYFSIQAYLPEEKEINDELCKIAQILSASANSVTLEYGPRYLHSTGQFHKGGPDQGIFFQFVSGSMADVPVPGEKFTFEALLKAQAFGDWEALTRKGRRAVLIDLGRSQMEGLIVFRKLLSKQLSEIAAQAEQPTTLAMNFQVKTENREMLRR